MLILNARHCVGNRLNGSTDAADRREFGIGTRLSTDWESTSIWIGHIGI
jgi:hypothetical protein